MRKSLALGLATVSLTGVGALVPAAANAANTTVTFTVGTPGLLTIATTGATVLTGTTSMSGAIPLTTVTDTRTSAGNWTVYASTTDFTLSGVTAPGSAGTITANNASVYTDTPVVAIPGTATVTDTHTSSGTALPLSTAASPLMTATTANANTVTYNPTLVVSVPSGQANGLYTGTVTQTVS